MVRTEDIGALKVEENPLLLFLLCYFMYRINIYMLKGI